MPNRHYSNGNSYRYGFNGKENDNGVVGTGSGTQDYGMRIYNPALGRFLSVDPISEDYPWYTPYQFAGNTPIQAVDLDGLEIYYSQDGKLIGAYGASTDIRVINEDQLATSKAEFAAFNDALKTNPTASNQFLEQTLLTNGSVAFEDYFTTVADVTNGAALETFANNGSNCNAAAKKQLANEGVTTKPASSAIQTKVDNTSQKAQRAKINPTTGKANNTPNLSENAIGGAIYVMTQLNKGNPVMVGLEEQGPNGDIIPSTVVPNYNSLTGHFVVIKSSTVTNGTVNFGYLDNSSPKCGTSSGNNLSLDKSNGSMTDSSKPCTGGVSSYEVSEVRKNN